MASYGVDDPEFAVVQLAQTTMRSELGKISLDKVFREREGLNVCIVDSINKASEAWGITCLRYEIRKTKKIKNKIKIKIKKPSIQKILMILIFFNRGHKIATKSTRSNANASRSGT